MKIIEPLSNIIDQPSKLKVLRFLIKTEVELSGREIGRAVNISHVIANRSLQDLSQHGLVKMRKAGRSILYSLNKENILLKNLLLPLFIKEKSLLQSVGKTILSSISYPKPISMVLFGSQIERHEARPDSDFDILCVMPDEINLKKFKQEISHAEYQIEKKFGNRLSLLVMKKREFLRRIKGNDSLVQAIEAQNIKLFGKPLREIK
jgi:DNA-binding transcriptional ArsR family regulator